MTYSSRVIEGDLEMQDAAEAKTAAVKTTAVEALRVSGAVLKTAARPLLVATLGLLVVWLIGRVMETVHDSTVFDMTLTYWFGMAVFILLTFWVIGSGSIALEAFRKARDTRLAAVSWLFFAVLVILLLAGFNGYRIAAAGMFAAIDRSAEFSEMATFLLFKFHALNPLLAVHLAVTKLMGMEWGLEALAPFVWRWNTLFAFFIWSVAYGIVLLMQKDKRGIKGVHLFLAAFGLLGLIVLKSVATPTPGVMVVIQAAATLMIVLQVLLAYAVLRVVADRGGEEAPKSDWSRVPSAAKERAVRKPFLGLPPPALRLALALFLVVPVLADLQSQFATAASSGPIARQIAANADGAADAFVTVASVSVRSGPATGDEVLAVLSKGTRVQVLDKKNDWVHIGANRWVPEKFLSPLGTK